MSNNNWNDFNNADLQQGGFDLIPRGTIVPVRMTLKPGGYDDASQGWTGGYATQSFETGSVYLAAEFVITGGPYAKRRLWTNIGLHSNKGPAWGDMGRSFVRAALNSARGVLPQDHSPQAAAARRIQSLADLDGLEFVARIDIERDGKGQDRNIVRQAVEPDNPEYAVHKGGVTRAPTVAAAPAPMAPTTPQPPSTADSNGGGKPAWAQ